MWRVYLFDILGVRLDYYLYGIFIFNLGVFSNYFCFLGDKILVNGFRVIIIMFLLEIKVVD